MTEPFDVIVIGGGLAGLAATQRLTAAGKRVALIEARSRFGGRVWTTRHPPLAHPIELGPEWFSSYGETHQLLARGQAAMPAADGRFLRRSNGEMVDMFEAGEASGELRRRLAELSGPDRPLNAALKACCPDSSFDGAARMLRGYVEGFHAADPDQLSVQWLRIVERNQGPEESELRSAGGLEQAVNLSLADIGPSCTAYLDTQVRAVRWQQGRVMVDCDFRRIRGAIKAAAGVVTLPLSILQLAAGAPGAVQFLPRLTAKRRALELLGMGPVLKVNLVFDAPFWADLPQVRDALFVQDSSQPIPTWWTTRPINAPVLVGWSAGAHFTRARGLEPASLRRTAIRSLSRVLGVSPDLVRRRLRGVHWHDWQRDPFSQGGYSWVRVGGVEAWKILAAPLSRTLYFAGEATRGDGFNATMDGAIESGWRAAGELLNRE